MLFCVVVALFACTINADAVVQGVAPGDEEQLCRDLRMSGIAPTPNYDPNMAILMDSNNYQNLLPNRTGAVWQQVDNDVNIDPTITTNWIQQSNSPCSQAVQVCGFTAGAQDNRLITQLINRTVNGTRLPRVSVLIEFELQDCDITLNCQRTFNTHVYETSSVDSAAARNVNNYRQVQRVSPSVRDGIRVNETVDIDFTTSHSSFYFSIEDETSCIFVTRVIVFYTVCPAQTVDMISYPLTIAPTSGRTTISTTCVDNAEPVGEQPKVVCSSDGGWDPPVSQCRCQPRAVSVSGACIQCLAGTYSSPSNGNCSQCPANSFSDRDGLAECTCNSGHYRTPGEEDLPCRIPPPPPCNIRVINKTEHTITLTWGPPVDYEGENITYIVYISLNNQPRIRVYQGPHTMFTVENLISGATYTVSVSTDSDLSEQVEEAGQFDTIASSVQVTLSGGPSDNTALAIGVSIVAHLVIMFVTIATTILIVLLAIRKCSSRRNEQLAVSANVAYGEVRLKLDRVATSSNAAYGMKFDPAAGGAVYEDIDELH